MPSQTNDAITWALTQMVNDDFWGNVQVTKNNPCLLVDKVRDYFNTNNITYSTFSYKDLLPYLN